MSHGPDPSSEDVRPQVGDVLQHGTWEGFTLIHRYTREEALRDGVLKDVTATAREAGFRVPVALTAGVWDLVVPTLEEHDRYAQSIQGRLWDVLWMAYMAIRRNRGGGDELRYHVLMLFEREGWPKKTMPLELKLLSHGGDDGEFVVTISLPDED